jgi:hypothetical protein
MSNLNGNTAMNSMPDASGPLTYTSAQMLDLAKYFGPSKNITIDSNPDVHYTGKTLEEAYGGVHGEGPNKTLTKYIVNALVDQGGWWFALAPAEQMPYQQELAVLTFDLTSAKLVPEGAPYEEVSYSEKTVSSKLMRSKLGGKLPADFFARPEGQEIFLAQLRQIQSGFWLFARFRVAAAVQSAKDEYFSVLEQSSVPVANLLLASQEERSNFGMIEKHAKSIYHAFHSARQVMARLNRVPNMAVLPPDTLTKLALTPFETEFFRNGSTAKERLTEGGDSLVNAFEGCRFYEDQYHHANNVPSDNYATFEELAMTGEYNIIDASRYDPTCDDSCGDRQLSTQIYDMDADRFVTVSLREILEKNLDMRWGDDGHLAPEHHLFIANIKAIAKRLDVVDPGPDVDAYAVFSQTAKDAGAENGGYFELEHYGEANPTFLRPETVVSRARQLVHSVSDRVSAQDFANIQDMVKLSRELSEPSDIDDPVLQAYFAAISFGNENETPYLGANEFGVPNPPSFSGGRMRVSKGGAVYAVHSRLTPDGKRVVYFSVGEVAIDQTTPVSSMPSRPYGYGTLPGMRFLASAPLGVDAWKDDASRAAKGLESFERFFDTVSGIFPHNSLLDVAHLPSFLRSGNERYDRMTMLFIGAVDRAPHPFSVRQSVRSGDVSAVRSLHFDVTGEATPGLVGAVPKSRLTFDLANLGLKDADFDEDTTAARVLPFLYAPVNTLLGTRSMPLAFSEALVNKELYHKLNNDFRLRYGAALTEFIRGELAPGRQAAITKPDYFLLEFIAAVCRLGNDANRQASVLNLWLVLLRHGSTVQATITRDAMRASYQDTLIGGGPVQQPGISQRFIGADIQEVRADTPLWNNSRLVIHASAWLASLSKSNEAVKALDSNLIRPTTPGNPLRTIAGSGIVGANVTAATAATHNMFQTFSKTQRSIYASSAAMQVGAFNESWYNTSEGRAVMERVSELSDAETWNATSVGGYLARALEDIVGWSTIIKTGEGLPRLVNRGFLRWRLVRVAELLRSSPATLAFANLLLLSRVHKETNLALLRENIAPLYSSKLLVRPFCQTVTGALMFAQGGRDAARFGWNYANANLTLNAAHDMWNFAYIVYVNATVVDETAIYIIHNATLRRHVGGRNTVPFTNSNQFSAKKPSLSSRSMFVFCLGGEASVHTLPPVLDIRGVLDSEDFHRKVTNHDAVFTRERLQLPILYYEWIWSFSQMNGLRNRRTDHSFAARKQEKRLNTVLYPGPQRNYNSAQKNYSDFEYGNSHWSDFSMDDNARICAIANGGTISSLKSSFIKD